MKVTYHISRAELKIKAPTTKSGKKIKSIQGNHEAWSLVIALLQKAEIK